MAVFQHGWQGGDPYAGQVEIDGRLVPLMRPNEKAVLFDPGFGPHKWLPRSKIRIEHDTPDKVRVFMPAWLARKNGFIR